MKVGAGGRGDMELVRDLQNPNTTLGQDWCGNDRCLSSTPKRTKFRSLAVRSPVVDWALKPQLSSNRSIASRSLGFSFFVLPQIEPPHPTPPTPKDSPKCHGYVYFLFWNCLFLLLANGDQRQYVYCRP